MRMHGQVGAALEALGVGECPLDAPSEEPAPSPSGATSATPPTPVKLVCHRAMDFAHQSEAGYVWTVHGLFAVLDVYGWAFDHELYRRGTSRDEIFARLAAAPAAGMPAE
jgi:hypothetical protein